MVIREVKAGRNVLSNLFKGTGAEIGVERGKFSKVILETADRLIAVDLWKSYAGYRTHVSDEEYEAIFDDFNRRVGGKNVTVIRASSTSAATQVRNDLDWIYVDANHDYYSVYEDLQVWYPKVKSGGVVSGHDWVKRQGFGVIQAVTDFCEERGIKEITIYKGDRSPSWVFIKP